ncbi:hypothetical protein TWF718_005300 [Orbilia javanica]|uniref:BTB domain-containing protein n=1 Tax=Orbilia javanica TaxID=47235 RepID=A0AAN8N3D8_9PEZI
MLQLGRDRASVAGFSSLFASPTTSVFFKSHPGKFVIHTDLLTKNSTYFANKIDSSCKTKDEIIYLQSNDYNIDAFKMFVEYCYLGTYSGGECKASELFLLHAKVCVLARKLSAPELGWIALRKATEWCRGDSMRPGGSRLSDMLPELIEAIKAVYGYTDPGSGYVQEVHDSQYNGWEVFKGDFRLLLAKLAAVNLSALKQNIEFMKVHHKFPEFSMNMLLYANPRPKALVAGTTAGESWASVQEDSVVKLRKNEILEFNRLFSGDVLTVFVGEEAKRFDIHTSAIQCSEYFKRLLASEMVEGREKKVYLTSEVDTVDAFNSFVQYCYLQDYFCDEEPGGSLLKHAAVYILAERLICPCLKTLALEKAQRLCKPTGRAKLEEIFPVLPAVVAMIYGNTYDTYTTKLLGTPNGSMELPESKPGEPPASIVPGASKPDDEQKNITWAALAAKDGIRDPFRALLARCTSLYIPRLRREHSFVLTHLSFPDFATDLVVQVNAGSPLEFDTDGEPKGWEPKFLSVTLYC